MLLVTAPLVPHGNTTVIVATAVLRFLLDQGAMRLAFVQTRRLDLYRKSTAR